MGLTNKVKLAFGYTFFAEHLTGRTFKEIAKRHHMTPETVKKYFHRAVDDMLEDARERVMKDLFPLAMDVFRERLKFDLQEFKLGKGNKVDMSVAERILKGMYVLDAPPPPTAPKQSLLKDLAEVTDQGNVSTLVGMMVNRTQLADPRLKDDSNTQASHPQVIDVTPTQRRLDENHPRTDLEGLRRENHSEGGDLQSVGSLEASRLEQSAGDGGSSGERE